MFPFPRQFMFTFIWLFIAALRAENGQFSLNILSFISCACRQCLWPNQKAYPCSVLHSYLGNKNTHTNIKCPLNDGDNDKCWAINMRIICYSKCQHIPIQIGEMLGIATSITCQVYPAQLEYAIVKWFKVYCLGWACYTQKNANKTIRKKLTYIE